MRNCAGMLKKALILIRLLGSGNRVDRIAGLRLLARYPVARDICVLLARRLEHDPSERYLGMQRAAYEGAAALGDVQPGDIGEKDYVVGSWRAHDEWPDYEAFLMRYVPEQPTWLALDFGCGPGRNINRWNHRFARIDGADIARGNLDNAHRYLANLLPDKQPNLFLTGGRDVGDAPADAYDFVFSTICLQHICVHSVRRAIFEDMYRVLRPGGRLSAQMGYGIPSPLTVGYYEDFVDAEKTNRGCDVAISSPDQPGGDLRQVGFERFESWVRPVGPGDLHPQWIFFTAIKPER